MKACFRSLRLLLAAKKGWTINFKLLGVFIISNETQFIFLSYALRHIFENQEVIFFCFPSPLAFIGLYNEGLLRF